MQVLRSAVTRCYSLSDRPDASAYRVTIKRVARRTAGVPAGFLPTDFHDRVQIGDILKAKAPAGHFTSSRMHSCPSC